MSDGTPPPVRLGYLVPEFPGQTHIFFWREMHALRALGVEPEVVSTQVPDARIQSHDWSDAARAQTTYLYPPGVGDSFKGAMAVLGSGPAGWWRTWRSVNEAGREMSRSRATALAVMGANLAALARRRGWAHVHVHSCADAALVAVFAHRLSGLSYSLTLHGPLGDYGPCQPLKWRHAAFGVIITRRLVDSAKARLRGDLPDDIAIAPMGVDLARFERTTPYEPWTGTGPARIVSCGRLNRIKGHQELIEAVRLLRDEGLDVRLTICGEDEKGGDGFHRDLQRQIDEAKLGGAVTLTGAVSETRVAEAMDKAHVFALASHHEPLGVAIMEGMAMALPVVSTSAGGVPELVTDGGDGVLVEPKSPERLAEAIRGILHDPDRARALGQAARAKVERSFHSGVSAQVIADRVKALAEAGRA